MKCFSLLLAVILSSVTLFAGEIVRTREVPASEIVVPDSVAVGDSFHIKLFDDVEMTLAIVAKPPAGIAGQSFIAKDDSGSASAIVKFSGNTARISIDDFMNRRQYTVRVKNGTATITERDNSQMDDGECGTCGGDIEVPQPAVEETKTTSTKKSRTLLGASDNEFPLASQKSVVDILVAFDQGAKAWALDKNNGYNWDNIEDCAEAAVQRMNDVLINSRLDNSILFRLVGVTEVDDTYSEIGEEIRANIRLGANALKKIPSLRDYYGADIVTLLIDIDGNADFYTTGIADGLKATGSGASFAYNYNDYNRNNYGYNICHIRRTFEEYTMAHEVGHCMGAGHSNRNKGFTAPQSAPYSCGYHFQAPKEENQRYRTIMGYNQAANDGGNYWYAAPYFSSPDLTPDEYGKTIGTVESNDNCRVLRETRDGVTAYRKNYMPYDWDVKFQDDAGNDIRSGTYFPSYHYVTLTHSNPNATIYYTDNGSMPTPLNSSSCSSGHKLYVNGAKTITACAVIDGVAQSMRTIEFKEGLTWSGNDGGNGLWINGDSSVRPWSGEYFYKGAAVVFPDLADISDATVTVKGAIETGSATFTACTTHYTFSKGDDDAKITIPGANFAPVGDLTFNVPVKLEAAAFTNMFGRSLTFNAPFGQEITETTGYCSNMIGVAPNATLTVAPGKGKTQTFEKLNNEGWYSNTSTFRVGEGKIVFNGEINGGRGVIGRTKLEVCNGGELVFNQGGGTGYDMDNTSLTVEKGGTVTFNDMELLKRTLYLDGGTIYVNRFDLMSNPGIYVTDDSAIEDNTEGYIYLRGSDSEINISDGKTLILGIRTDNRNDTAGNGIVKKGGGTLVANKELKHSGKTIVSNGTITVGYSSSDVFGGGWKISSGAQLTVKNGCALKVPALSMDSGAELTLPIATTMSLTVTNTLDLAGVNLQLTGDGNYVGGDRFTIVTAEKGIVNAESLTVTATPALAEGLKWEFEISENSIVAWVKDYGALESELKLVSNDSNLAIAFPNDAEVGVEGGIVIGSNPLVVDGLSTKAVAITLDVEIPDNTLAEDATICSWQIGDNIVRCVRRSDANNNRLYCYYGPDDSKVDDPDRNVNITPGHHIITIAYYSLSDDTHGGTSVYLDNILAYRAAALRWSNDSVKRITVGATADDPATRPYEGLIVKGLGVINALSKDPIPNVTASGGVVKCEYMTQGHPCVFALPPAGGFMLNSSILRATIGSDRYDRATVSLLAAFPIDKTGTIFGLCISDYSLISYQAEYSGNGEFSLRTSDNDSYSGTCNIDVSRPHIYTIAYDGSNVSLYIDGNQIIESDSVWGEVVNEIDFGCGYWNDWSSNNPNNPNPMSNFIVYASHIALGTSDRAVSESAVAASIATEEDCPEPPETPAVVDVLVAYDLGAQAYVANKGVTLAEFAQTQIDKMNDVLVTNKLDRFYSYRLAGVCKVDGVYDNIDTAPAQIAAGTGPAVSLRAAREMCGADTVTLLVDVSGNTLGNSSPLNSPDNVASQHECAFSVCSIRAVDTGKQHTMIHENAHNMGCGHARAQSIINSPFEYGRGYYFKDGNVTRHTIMAYGGDNDASWYFSTASKEFGFTLGDKTNNNARVLKETCGEVAKWREGSAIDFSGIELDGVTWQTSKKYPWTTEGDAIRSYNQTNYTYQCTTPLAATIEGPRVLSFKHKSYFLGKDLGSNYSHIEVLLDDSAVLSSKRCNTEWSDDVKVYIPDGKHTVQFVYSQRDAMNNPKANKDNYPATMDDALWLKDIALSEVPESLFWSSTSEYVSWLVPGYSTVGDEHLDSVAINDLGIVNYLDFGSTNAVCASVLAELPEGAAGIIIGCQLKRDSNTFYAFAYSNGNGTFSLGHTDTTDTAISSAVENWTAPHVWTFAFGAQTGAKLYCDGKEIASTTVIQWASSEISGPITFGNDRRNKYPLPGMKIYSAHTDFGVGSAIFERTDDSADQTLQQLGALADFAGQNVENQLAALNLYRETGAINPKVADSSVLRISEIMPKPTDAQNRGALEGMDVNGLESGWVEVENTSDQWADLADYRFIRVNRGKKTDPAGFGNFPPRLVPPRSRAIFYTSERYSNSKDQAVSAFENGKFKGKPEIFKDYGNILVWGDKVNPKKSPFVRLYYMPNAATTNVVDTVVIPSDLPEGWSIIVGDAAEGEGTRRWMCSTPTRGRANTSTDGLKRIGPNVGPLYEIKDGKKHEDSSNEFARPVPPAKPGEDYSIMLPINPVMNPDGTLSPRTKDKIESIKLVCRKDLDDATLTTNVVTMTAKSTDKKGWGDQYTATIPASYLPTAGHLIQWKVLITDGEGVEWTSPSFNNPDDGYEWYGTIVEAPELESATLPTWHMFASGNHLTQMDKDKDKQDKSLVPNYARVAIYDSSTSNYYDYVRIDLRGNTSKNFTKKGHGLRFAKAHPLTMVDSVTGETIEEIRKTSLISEFADPSYMRQMIAFWLWRKMGNLVPFDFPVRCNLNGEFYQLAFNSERFTDELIEDVYGLDKFGYSYKNVGTMNLATTTAGSIEKKTPDDEDESNISVLTNSLVKPLQLNGANVAHSTSESASLTKFVVKKFDLPAWLNYLASARITQEMDDVWANVCAYYDNPDMLEGVRGKDTWMPLGYDFNLTFGQYYINDLDSNALAGLSATNDWYKSHPLYGGWTIRARKSPSGSPMNGNNGFEAIYQSAKFRRLYLRRLRTLMDQELKEPGTPEGDTPFMSKMREMADLMRADATLDQSRWPNNGTDNAIDVWGDNRPVDMDAGIDDIWCNYVVPRREHLYVTHSVTNTAKAIGYGLDLNAGIPEAQSPISALAPNIVLDFSQHADGVVVVSNLNNEVVDMSGWTLRFGVEWTLPAGTVCDSNDCIYVVADRRAYIEAHNAELTDQVIVGNATFSDWSAVYFDAADGTVLRGVSSDDSVVTFEAKDQKAADKLVAELSPALTEEDVTAELQAQYLKVVAEPTGKKNEFVVTVAVNPETVGAPVIAEPAAESEPVEIEEDDKGETTVSVSISNAIQGLWYGYEVSDALGEAADFANDVDSFERAEGSAHTVKGSPRDKASGFFRIKVLPAKPSH